MSETSARPAFPLVISGPSGAGKTSVTSWLLREDPDTVLSVSCTTRPRRGDEVEGVDYFYIGESEFLARRDRGEFLEWALVYGRLYGTPESFLDRKTKEGKVVLLDIDVQGGMQIREASPEAVLVFLMPPSMEVLEERLRGRHTDSEEVIERRLRTAREEMKAAPSYDYLIVSHELDGTREAVRAIVEAERRRASRVLSMNPVRTEPILMEARLGFPETSHNLERK